MSGAAVTAPPTARFFAEVAVPAAWSSTVLSYDVPQDLEEPVQEGSAVWVSLRGKPVQGVVLQVHDRKPEFPTQPIIGLTDPPVVLSPIQMRTARWMARETASGLMDALGLFLPPGTTQQTRAYLEASDKDLDTSPFTPAQRKLLNFLADRSDTSIESARTAMGSSLASVIPALEKAGALRVRYRIVTNRPSVREEHWVRLTGAPDLANFGRAPKQAELLQVLQRRARLAGDGYVSTADLLAQTGLNRQVVKALVEKGVIEEITRPRGSTPPQHRTDAIPELTPAQATAWEAIEHSLQDQAGETFLLYGVTGSGKTEIYLRASAWCLRHGRSALILTPEIALSSQVAARFTARFGDQVAILHSALSPAERSATWQGVAEGVFPIVVGPRSALFAPVQNLGLIVLDEEHDQAYKQGEPPPIPLQNCRRVHGRGNWRHAPPGQRYAFNRNLLAG